MTDSFADVDERIIDINVEELIKRDPDVIIATYGGSETDIKNDARAIEAIRGIEALDRVAAVRKGQIISINFAYLVGGPLAIDGLEIIADKLDDLP
jgi:iron complex transport system substrate-binding protein